MWAGLTTVWLVGVPLAYFFGFYFHWGVIGIRIGRGIGIVLSGSILFIRWYQKSRLQKLKTQNT